MSPTSKEYAEVEPVSDLEIFGAEAIGTFILVFSAVGTAVFAGDKVGNLGVAMAFGLTLAFLVYSIGSISGCHVNPAVTVGQFVLGRLSVAKASVYIAAQVLGGLVAGAVIYLIAQSLPSYDRAEDGLAANGWGEHSPSATEGPLGGTITHGYGIGAAMTVEIVFTAILVFVILASTDRISSVALAGVSIGFALAVINLASIPIDNTSVNPVRSLAVAPYQNGALPQLWLFIVFPLIGGVVGALVYRSLFARDDRLQS
ncbi:AraC family transcriptional regulator [Rhodococcus sp. WMMA185]|uniref:aquaporin n=1 Tax=Rhodococcus sp. WMMA185 TaxID=679318 RepID=UPI000877EB9C|nr:aquaporin [Rhodococcus sp. WMMA185]AOW94779.1 AraC family transcriptional regulator [Rhodococcus sp. WMMA185]